MKLQDAYRILELPDTATPDEAKKKYRELAKKLHPDQNQGDAEAEAKFKRINEAYQIIQKGEEEPPPVDWNNFNIRDPFSTFFHKSTPFGTNSRQYYASTIDLYTTLSFKESIQGCKKEINYSRQTKCPYCQGSGNKPINNGCKTCGGRGQVTNRAGGSVFVQTCHNCHGRAQTNSCKECNTTGVVSSEASVHVSVPACVVEGNILRLHGMGNFAGSLMGLQDQYTDVHLHISVTPEPGLRLEGKDVVSDLDISLLEALQGCTKEIKTIDGNKEIKINDKFRNKDEVVLSVGDHNSIKHRVIVNVGYPTNIDKLIDVLLEEGR